MFEFSLFFIYIFPKTNHFFFHLINLRF
ncbi:hypothetical protein CY0110_15727 [Crocosphaera chwakensis CCY0110]|uniref:Uncharacterized protein n=1 Tax=Crocosphaera chwakensis CCY0110 TaxID=391612 RepID=A3IHH7_9CHRO|nr:hypothetical protein CY0110_15727 [Crocosphaera chwakensis CCY0110]